jgi:CTP:molybdopterin cytidylyltransferase MocA
VEGIAIVTHVEIASRLETLDLPKAFIARNDDPHSEMIDSVRIGLASWRAWRTIHDDDGFLVCPADHPGLSREDFDACIRAFRSSPDKIVVASRQGRRGHPILFAARYVGFVESAACNAGLNFLVRKHPNEVMTIECASPGVTRDLDSPEDFEDFTRGQ